MTADEIAKLRRRCVEARAAGLQCVKVRVAYVEWLCENAPVNHFAEAAKLYRANRDKLPGKLWLSVNTGRVCHYDGTDWSPFDEQPTVADLLRWQENADAHSD